MTDAKPTVYFGADHEKVRQYIDDAVAKAINEAAAAIRAVRDWCDSAEHLARGHLSWEHAHGVCCVRSRQRLDAACEIRALLPVSVSGSPVGEVNPMTGIDPEAVAAKAREAARKEAAREHEIADALRKEIDGTDSGN